MRQVLGDALRLRQILTNLISNAIKFTSKGLVKISIKTILILEQFVRIKFEVQDTGIGIPIEKQGQLFQIFSQGDSSTSRQYGGTGLGLAISQSLTNKMGGEILIDSHVGQGSCFYFEIEFPIVRTRSSKDLLEVAVLDENYIWGGKTILVAEDNALNRKVMAKILAKFESNIVWAEDGEAVLEQVKNHPIDLILMDCQMPLLDGYGATELLRKQGFDKTIVALTANSFPEDRDRAFQSGMNDFLSKPVTQQQLGKCFKKWFGN